MRADCASIHPPLNRLKDILMDAITDPTIKEAVISPGATRVVVQVAQGQRSAHLLFRQARFNVNTVPADVIRHGISVAAMLRTAADLSMKPAEIPALIA
jgi:hypothetical protein